MTKIEYLSMTGPQRFAAKFLDFFRGIPPRVSRYFSRIPMKALKAEDKVKRPFLTLGDALGHGNWVTRCSALIWGLGLMTRRQVIRGAFYLLFEIAFIAYMVLVGAHQLAVLPSLGQMAEVSYMNEDGIRVYAYFDDSFTVLIFSVVTIVIIGIAVYLWYNQLKDSIRLQRFAYIGRYRSDKETLENVLDASYDKTLLAIPMFGLVCFTIVPTLIMILVGFTNYSSLHLTPKALIDWVGFANFAKVFGSGTTNGSLLLYAFGMVVLWTLVWAFFATFSNYFLGMWVAMLINSKGIRLKKMWRTILITTIAVPQFISLLLMNRMLNQDMGIFNQWLMQLGWITTNIPWLNSPVLTKVVIILVNTWIGIPYTMLICTGLLMNIPNDLYESAKIDGAGPWKTYTKITLPYMLFVTTPYLISQFVGNINNFNVIYLLSGGNPVFTFSGTNIPYQLSTLGQSDLLITWIYKLSLTNSTRDYGYAAVLGLMIFVVVAFFSLIFYNNAGSVKNEEEFQ